MSYLHYLTAKPMLLRTTTFKIMSIDEVYWTTHLQRVHFSTDALSDRNDINGQFSARFAAGQPKSYLIISLDDVALVGESSDAVRVVHILALHQAAVFLLVGI